MTLKAEELSAHVHDLFDDGEPFEHGSRNAHRCKFYQAARDVSCCVAVCRGRARPVAARYGRSDALNEFRLQNFLANADESDWKEKVVEPFLSSQSGRACLTV